MVAGFGATVGTHPTAIFGILAPMTAHRFALLALVLLSACEDEGSSDDAGTVDAAAPPSVPSPEATAAHQVRLSVCLQTVVSSERRPAPTPSADELDQQRCTVAADNCEDVLECIGVAIEDPCTVPEARCVGTQTAACIETILGPRELRRECASTINPQCALVSEFLAQCVRSTECSEPSRTCEGNDRVFCGSSAASIEQVLPCTDGLSCVDGSCILSPEPCEESCDGDVAVNCRGSEAVLARTDCAALGATCEVVDTIAQCTPTDPECEPASARCDGEVAQICGTDGRWQSFDCAGFAARCESTDSPARCVR